MRGWFVTATDTGVGKSVLAGALVAALRSRGVAVRALKPIITGLQETADPAWPPDHELLAAAAGGTADDVALVGFQPPVSPHLAADLAGRKLDVEQMRDAITAAVGAEEVTVIEGVGGLLVPLSWTASVRDLARELDLPLLIAARPGLGTINHTLLTLEAARAANLRIEAVVLTPWPEQPEEIERSNRESIELLGNVSVATLPRIERAHPELLASAAESLPLDRWLS